MANPKNREAVEQALQQELERDRTKTYVVEISPLGLVEMTRQNVTDGPREILTRKCPTCAGEGVVVSEATAVVDAERQAARARRVEAAHEGVQGGAERPRRRSCCRARAPPACEEIEAPTRRRFFVDREGAAFRHDHFAVLDEGTVEKLAGRGRARGRRARRSSSSSSRSAARRRRRGRRRSTATTCRVGGAAKLVGKKVYVRDRACARRDAYARLPVPRPRRPIRADHRRGPGREADARLAGEKPEAPGSSPKRARAGSRVRGESSRARARTRAGERRNGRGGAGCRPRRRAEEEDPPRLAWWPGAEEEAGRSGRVRRALRVSDDAVLEASEPAAKSPTRRWFRGCAAEEEDAARLARRPWPQEARRRCAPRRTARSRRRPAGGAAAVRRSMCRRRGRRARPPRERRRARRRRAKKTRRGSRGGRRRRKPAGATSGETTAAGPRRRQALRRELGPRDSAEMRGPPSRSFPRAPTRRAAHGSERRHAGRRPRPGARGRRRRRRRRTSAGATAEQLGHPLVEPRIGLHHPLVGREEHGVEQRGSRRALGPEAGQSRCSRCEIIPSRSRARRSASSVATASGRGTSSARIRSSRSSSAGHGSRATPRSAQTDSKHVLDRPGVARDVVRLPERR